MSKFITIATFHYPHEAYILKSKLEAEGINAFIQDELTIQSANIYSNIMGGARLQIAEHDLDKLKMLVENGDIHLPNLEVPPSKLELFTEQIPVLKNMKLEFRYVILMVLLIVGIAAIFILFQSANLFVEKNTYQQHEEDLQAQIERLKEIDFINATDALLYEAPLFAYDSLQSIIKLYPKRAILHESLGYVLYQLDSFEASANQFMYANDIRHYESGDNLFNIAQCKLALKDSNSAHFYLEQASKKSNVYVFDLAVFYEEQQRYQLAIEQYETYLANIIKASNTPYNPEDYKDLNEKIKDLKRKLWKKKPLFYVQIVSLRIPLKTES